VANGERRPEVAALEDDRDLARAVVGELRVVEPRERTAEADDISR
jgi:hypothetical protein